MFPVRGKCDRLDRAVLGTLRAADAVVGDDVADERLTLARGATSLDMCLVFVPEGT